MQGLNVPENIKPANGTHIYHLRQTRIYRILKVHVNWNSNGQEPIQSKSTSCRKYRNDPKFSDRYAWANSADPDLRRSLIRVYTVCYSVCIVWTHYSMVEPLISNFRRITTKYLNVMLEHFLSYPERPSPLFWTFNSRLHDMMLIERYFSQSAI